MSLSGTYDFTMDVGSIIDFAIDLAGGRPALGIDPVRARQAINLLQIDWANRGINLWTLEQITVTAVSGTGTYTLDSRIIDVIDATRSVSATSSGTTLNMERISQRDYMQIAQKELVGVPSQWYTQRNQGSCDLVVWQKPDSQTDSFKLLTFRFIQDVNKSPQDVDIPKRFLPAIIYGLAYYMLMFRTSINREDSAALQLKMVTIKTEYDRLLMEAQGEDRERASFRTYPRFSR